MRSTNMNKKIIVKTLVIIAIFSTASFLSLGNLALADNDNNKGNSKKLGQVNDDILNILSNDNNANRRGLGIGVAGDQQSGIIRPNGDFRVTGVTVNSISTSTNTLNVSFFGFTRDVNISGAQIFARGGAAITISDIRAGDKLVATGNFNSSTKALTVKQIRDVSLERSNAADNLQQRINQLLELVKKLQDQLNALR